MNVARPHMGKDACSLAAILGGNGLEALIARVAAPTKKRCSPGPTSRPCNHCGRVSKEHLPIDGLPGEVECSNVTACEKRILKNLTKGKL